jgi:hypothetical protein
MLAAVTYSGPASYQSSPGGSLAGWSLVPGTQVTSSDNSETTEIYRKAVSSQSMSIGLTFSTPVMVIVTMLESNLTYIDSKGTVSTLASAETSPFQLVSPAAVPSFANDFLLYFGGYVGSGNAALAPVCAPQTGWTQIQSNKGPSGGSVSSPNVGDETSYFQLTGSAPTTGYCTLAAAADGNGSILAFEPYIVGQATPAPTAAPTAVPSASAPPTSTPTGAPSASASPSASPSATPTSTATASASPSASPSASASASPTASASAGPDYCYVAIGNAYGYTTGQELQSLPGGNANYDFHLVHQPCGAVATPAPGSSSTPSGGGTATPTPTATPYGVTINGTVNVVQGLGISTLAFVPQVYGGSAPSFSNPAPLSNSYPPFTDGVEFWLGSGSGTGGDPGPDCVQIVYWNVGYYGAVPTNLNALGSVVAPQICGTVSGSAFAPLVRTVVSIAPAQGWNIYIVGINSSAASGGPRWRAVQ